MTITVSFTENLIKDQGLGKKVTLAVYAIDYTSQGLTLLNYLFVIFKLADIEIMRAENSRASRDFSFPSEQGEIVNTFNEVEFMGDEAENEFVVSRMV